MVEALAWTAAVSAAAALALVGLVRRVALRHGVLDHPTDRSSHAVATPRGGGLGLLVAVLGVCAWRAANPVWWPLVVMLLAASAVAWVGWIDDRRGLSVRTRLVVHIVAGATVGGAAALTSASAPLTLFVFAAWTFWTVSSINLVNFMDGINGLVASQIAVFALSLACFPDHTNVVAFVEMAVAGACIGFLPWNFPRARIFLGDVGSGALGFFVPMLALLAMQGQGIDVVRAHLPLLPLFGDATWTIFRRWRNGERLTAPHRSHLYQRLANDGLGHTPVTAMYTVAAVCGALAAHASGDAWVSPWTLSYAAMILLAGFILHRRATGAARAAT
jgi:UDP-N-acetylmuramyl pentapeptide phosphotransferase/UDP-N-acetylglucosamine-1-phosphate transferase